jgi:hypothetical protein
MKDYPYFPLYIAEFYMDTAGMSHEEIGQYMVKIIKAWKTMDMDSMPDWLSECMDERIQKSKKLSDNAKKRWYDSKEKKSRAIAKQLHNKQVQLESIGEEKRGEDSIGEDRIDINTGITPSEILSDVLGVFNECYPEFSYTPRSKDVKLSLAKKTMARMKSFPDMVNIIREESSRQMSSFVYEGNWFSYKWLVKNDDNFEKFAIGNYRERIDGRVERIERATQGAIDALSAEDQY